MAIIVGIAGYAGSGKDTLAWAVHDALPEGTADVLTFAAPIRDIAQGMGLAIFDRERKEETVTIRYGHFELELAGVVETHLTPLVGSEVACEVYAHFATLLRDGGYVETRRADHLTISPRKFCQLLGTEVGRKVSKQLWVTALLSAARRCSAEIVLVPDVRFPNEADVCKYLIYVDRGHGPANDHESESHAPELARRATVEVSNTSTLGALEWSARRLAGTLEKSLRNPL